ncbi:uncharacterized protein FIBRA_08987 [Fibroporia radiculosa]|uniref:Uncharacterized protein n=1 Tax=Fibroporia radiculosa TaxID=599839 RepID=J4H5G5_9APHY|nr:uncharacterized protein FIBRA_08987 [Fibroporia radiculosa]CCM06699.1 predicted protein [Fibroporia radiculosa]
MSFTSLNTLRWDIAGLMVKYCDEAAGMRALHEMWRTKLREHIEYLGNSLNIPRTVKPKSYFSIPELVLLVETAIAESHCLDATLVHVFLWTIMQFTAARPGSLLSTAVYKTWFLRYRELRMVRTDIRGAFTAEPWLLGWKGGHGFDRWQQAYRLTPVKSESHLLCEPGLLMSAQGLRRQLFRDHNDVDSLIDGKEAVIAWKPEIEDLPVFAALRPRGRGINPDIPLSDDGARMFLRKICIAAGLGDNNMTPYCFRRGAANTLSRVVGSELSKSILHHRQHSATLYDRYIMSASEVDLIEAVAYGKHDHVLGLSPLDAPALWRPNRDELEGVKMLSLEEAIVMSPDLRQLTMQKAFLRQQSKIEGAEWTDIKESLSPDDISYVESIVTKDPDANACLALYRRISIRANRQYSDMRQRYAALQRRHALNNAKPLTIDELDARLRASHKGSDLSSLLKRTVEVAALEISDNYTEDEEVMECNLQESDDISDPSVQLQESRIMLLRQLVAHEDPHDGPQICVICNADEALAEEVRTFQHVSRSKLQRHIEIWHSGRNDIHELGAKKTISLSELAGQVGDCSLLGINAAFACETALQKFKV